MNDSKPITVEQLLNYIQENVKDKSLPVLFEDGKSVEYLCFGSMGISNNKALFIGIM